TDDADSCENRIELVGRDSELEKELLALSIGVRLEEYSEGVRVTRVLEHCRKMGRDSAANAILPPVAGQVVVQHRSRRCWVLEEDVMIGPLADSGSVRSPGDCGVDHQVLDPTDRQRLQPTGP